MLPYIIGTNNSYFIVPEGTGAVFNWPVQGSSNVTPPATAIESDNWSLPKQQLFGGAIFNWYSLSNSSLPPNSPITNFYFTRADQKLFGGAIFNWPVYSSTTSQTPNYLPIWTIVEPYSFGGAIIVWGSNGLYSGAGTVLGSHAGSTGPLRLVMAGNSATAGTVQMYNDGMINIDSFSVKGTFPVKLACQGILQQSDGKASTYKLAVIQNSDTVFTVRSVKWGSLQTITEDATDDQLINNHYLDTGNAPD